MQMETKQILKVVGVVAWILFIGLCIRTGAFIISFFVSLAINSQAANDLYAGMNLSELLLFSKTHYIVLVSLVIILSGLKAYLFYWVVKIISKINIDIPFSKSIGEIIMKMSAIALQIGITAVIANSYAKWIMKKGIRFSYDAGETEFLFLAGILFVIAVIFKKGIELQQENELTI